MYYDNFDIIRKINNKDSLLICIGDSWTWGDSLTDLLQNTKHMYEESLMESKHSLAERKELCYGNRLSKRLDSDWLNIAYPGESNLYILNKIKECIVNPTLKKYKKIYYIIVLTETGRELNKINNNVFQYCSTLNQYLATSETYILEEIKKLDIENIIITRNFTKSFNGDKYKSWIEINGADYDILPTGFITQKAFRDNTNVIQKIENWKTQIVKQYNSAEAVFNFLHNSKLHHKKSTKHPTAESHELWADYLYSIIQDKKWI